MVPVDELGIPTYDELVLVANSDRVADDPEAIRLFIAALERGTRDAVADPAAATEAVLDAGDGLDAEADPGRGRRAPCRCCCRRTRSQPFGYMDAARVGALRRLLRRPRPDLDPPGGSELFTDELLPD